MRTIQRFRANLQVRSRQGGAVILLVTFSLIAFLALMALALDVGQMYIIKSQLQNAADAGALRGAKELNGTGGGVDNARNKAQEAAADGNGFLLVADRLQKNQVTVEVAEHPAGPWVPASGITTANNYYFTRVWTTASSGANKLATFFAGILGVWDKSAQAVAIAGRFPQGRLMPMYMPILRRNDNQTNGTYCAGKIFNSKSGVDYSAAANCPPADPSITIYRGPDHGDTSGNKTWGYLRPGETRTYPSGENSPAQASETGGSYIFRMDPNADPEWLVTGTSWTGNFGWLIEGSTQLEIQQAVCKGTTSQAVTIPGCAEVHTGGLSVPQFIDALNSRFDTVPEKSLPKDMSYALCPADRNVYQWNTVPPSAYDQYKVNSPTTPPPSHPSGALNRRLMRLYIVDNYMRGLPGYNDGTSTCLAPLTGSTHDAHVVGCAEFFMWRVASKASNGLLYAEFVRRVPDGECKLGSGPETFNEIRLYR